MTLSILTESAATVTGVERVSIWRSPTIAPGIALPRTLPALDGPPYQRRDHPGRTLPVYFQALAGEGAIVADAPYLHPPPPNSPTTICPSTMSRRSLIRPSTSAANCRGAVLRAGRAAPASGPPCTGFFRPGGGQSGHPALVEYEAAEACRQARYANQRLRAVFDASRRPCCSPMAIPASSSTPIAGRGTLRLFPRGPDRPRHQRQLHPAWEAERCSREFRRAMAGEERAPVRMPILRADGAAIPVEIQAEVADLGDGRRLALGIFRPL